MISNESELRVALQAVLATVLALNGYWGVALLMVLLLLPWRPIFAVGSYLAQPVVDWRVTKARDRDGKGGAQVDGELDFLLRSQGEAPSPARLTIPTLAAHSMDRLSFPQLRLMESPGPSSARPLAVREEVPMKADPDTALAIRVAIMDHARGLPWGRSTDMNLELESISLCGEKAEVHVRFQSPNVSALVIRQRYEVRKLGERWRVERRQAHGSVGRYVPPSYHSGPVDLELMKGL